MVVDLVAVTVGSDYHNAASPLLPLPPAGGHQTKCLGLGLAGLKGGGIQDGLGPDFHDRRLSQGLLHVGGHRADGFENQPSDETGRWSCASGPGGTCSSVREPVVDD